jgi:uncharacterized protein (UPF0218 family)
MVVEGEEDLMVLPVIAAAPIGSIVYYGSPPISGNEGLVEVIITKETKKIVKDLINQFTK